MRPESREEEPVIKRIAYSIIAIALSYSALAQDLSEAQRAAMVKRGRRLDESKPGSGLGLSIVHDLVTSYRGELGLSRSDLGGLKAELTLPAVKP